MTMLSFQGFVKKKKKSRFVIVHLRPPGYTQARRHEGSLVNSPNLGTRHVGEQAIKLFWSPGVKCVRLNFPVFPTEIPGTTGLRKTSPHCALSEGTTCRIDVHNKKSVSHH